MSLSQLIFFPFKICKLDYVSLNVLRSSDVKHFGNLKSSFHIFVDFDFDKSSVCKFEGEEMLNFLGTQNN